MRHVLLYVCGMLFFHALPPLVAGRPALLDLPAKPHLMMYATASVVAIFTLRSQRIMDKRCLFITLGCLSSGALLILVSSPAVISCGLLIIGGTVPILTRHAFEDAAKQASSVGSMLGYSSFILEGTAFTMGVLATFISPFFAHAVLALVPILILVWVSLSEASPHIHIAAPRLNIISTIRHILPAVAANTAFFLFLSGVALAGSKINPLQVGNAVAITAIGFSAGAFLSNNIRGILSDRTTLIIFSLCGMIAGVVGVLFSINQHPNLIYLISIGISLSNGVIISTVLSNERSNHKQEFTGLPADNALVFLIASGFISLIFTFIASQLINATVWVPIVLAYIFGIFFVLYQSGPNEVSL